MKFKNLALTLASFSVILISCKKDNKTSPESTPNPYTAVQGYDAEIYSLRDMVIGSGVLYRTDAAIFFATTMYPGVAVSSVDAGVVSINATILKKSTVSSPGPSYMDTTNAIAATFSLNVSGSSQFPSGTLVYGQNYPAFNDTMLVPSSVSLSSGVSLQFNNCLNTDSVSFLLQDAAGHSATKRYAVSGNQASIAFSAADLAALIPTSNGTLYVDLVKKNIVIVGTKIYGVTLEKRYAKISVQFN